MKNRHRIRQGFDRPAGQGGQGRRPAAGYQARGKPMIEHVNDAIERTQVSALCGAPGGFAFEIFRTYLGEDYKAKATAGSWLLMSTGDLYPSLNELSRAIGAKAENAWVNWFYIDPNGDREPVSVLRDHSKIIRRKKSS